MSRIRPALERIIIYCDCSKIKTDNFGYVPIPQDILTRTILDSIKQARTVRDYKEANLPYYWEIVTTRMEPCDLCKKVEEE